ncbi:CMGC/CLK protein kinase [Coprinopsis cinerea AmutBmut pab1-1]|nr:CMGC/CLK protein kinase [Coprinopsis cinerea AmutBmut pab1-1]
MRPEGSEHTPTVITRAGQGKPSLATTVYNGAVTLRRIEIGDFLDKKFCVYQLGSFSGPCQTIRAREIRTGRSLLLRAIRKSSVLPDALFKDLQAVEVVSKAEDHFVRFTRLFQTELDTFLVFEDEGVPLSSIIRNNNIATFSPRQVREIVWQTANALDFLHSHGITHGDLCPSNIKLSSIATVQEVYFDWESRSFDTRKVLKSTELRVCFFGSLGVDNRSRNHDRFRSPEVVAGIGVDYKTDIFSLGCLMKELIINRPFLYDCMDSMFYVRDKLWVMENILGSFPQELAETIEAKHAGVFTPWWRVATSSEDHFDDKIVEFVGDSDTLPELIRDRDALEVIRSMTAYRPSDRPSIWVLTSADYFRTEF